MKKCWFVLGLTLACAALPALAQNRMPVPVEDEAKPAAPTDTAPAAAESPTSPYGKALVAYKAGDYDKAYAALQAVDPATQNDDFIILESRILTELKKYDEGEKLLRARLEKASTVPLNLAEGELLLRRRSFDRAAKYFEAARQAKPNDPDIILELVYARIGAADLIGAGKLASTLAPFDPKNPYDDHPCYYFARAALAQATGREQEAETEIQAARTNYGITVTNRYLKGYLQFFSSTVKNPSAELEPPPHEKK